MRENEILESLKTREELIGRTEVLDKVKELILLPNTEYATTQQVADYFEVGESAIKSLVFDNNEEVTSDGYKVLSGQELAELKSIANIKTRAKSMALFSKNSIVRIAMLLTNSEVAENIRKELVRYNPELYYKLTKRNQLRFKKYETEIKNFLEFTFGKNNVKSQVRCGKYILDFVLFDTVHIEVDENGHSGYNGLNEKIREEYIINNTDYYTFRYNPQKDKPSILLYYIYNLFDNIGYPNDIKYSELNSYIDNKEYGLRIVQ